MAELDIDEVVFNLKATIASSKGGVLLRNLESDYRNIIGEPLPYEALGYSSLIQFIQSFKAFKIDRLRCDPIVNVVSDVKTQHLEEMIRKQKTSKKSKCRKKTKFVPKKFSNTNNYNNSNFMQSNYKRKIYPVSSFNKFNSGWSSTNKFNSKLPKNNEIEKRELINKQKTDLKNDVLVKVAPISEIKKPTINIIERETNTKKNTTTNIKKIPIYFNNVQNISPQPKPKKLIKLGSQTAAQDRLRKFVKKTNCETETNLCDNVSFITNVLNHLNLKTSELTKTHSINKTPLDLPTTTSSSYPDQSKIVIHQLKIEDKSKLIVTVTAVNNVSDIWIVLNDTKNNNNYLKMQEELNEIDKDNQTSIEKHIVVDRFYALFYQNKWHRVKVECVVNDSIKCFLVDVGNSVNASRHQIYPLESKFFDICGQAVNIMLNKLKSFDDFPSMKKILIEKLIDNKFILIPNSVITSPPVITLYDVKTMTNVNDMIINTFYEVVTPNFPSTDGFNATKAKVLSIDEGYLYLQPNENLMNSLEHLFSTNSFSTPHLKSSRDIDYKYVYLTAYKPNIKGRVKVLHFIDESKVKVFFIDYGTYSVIDIPELIDLQKINSIIARIPCQAVKVTLHMFPPQDVTKEIEDIFHEILVDDKVLVFGITNLNSSIPCVQLWSDAYPDTYINIILYIRYQKLKEQSYATI